MNIYESGEDYLEMILMLRGAGSVRSIDVVREMGVSKPSVSVAMKKLRESGYVEMDSEGHITLTASGESIATSMYERHMLLSRVLEALGVDAVTARADACKIEHDLSESSFEAIRRHYEKFRQGS